MHGNQGVITFLVIFAIVVIIFVSSYFSRKAVVKRALRKAQEKRIGEFANGDSGKVVGEVVFAGETLAAPLSGRRCVYYHVIVEEYRSSGKSGHWHEIINEEQKGDIVLSDGTHYALVEFTVAKSYIVPDANYRSGFLNDATPELEAFLSQRGYSSTGLLGMNRSLRYKEGVLEHKETFAVAGKGQWSETKKHNLNIPAQRILVITPGEDGKLYLSDDPDTTEPAN